MKHNELVETVELFTGKKPKQREFAEATGLSIGVIGKRAERNSEYNIGEVLKVGIYFGIDNETMFTKMLYDTAVDANLIPNYKKVIDLDSKREYINSLSTDYTHKKVQEIQDGNSSVKVLYRPNVYLSAGYGIEVADEKAEYMVLDKRLFFTDRGLRINPKNCEIVAVSGNSMAPEYRHGDRVIIDKSVTEFSDGHIFAFRYNGECYIKEINLLGNRIKAVPLNKEYDSFYIEKGEDVKILGRIIPRVRL